MGSWASSRSFFARRIPAGPREPVLVQRAARGVLRTFTLETTDQFDETVGNALIHDFVVRDLELLPDLDLRLAGETCLTLLRRYTLHRSGHRSFRPSRLAVVVHGVSSAPALPRKAMPKSVGCPFDLGPTPNGERGSAPRNYFEYRALSGL